MQNQLDNGQVLYTEFKNVDGFVIREMHEPTSPNLKFQAGYHAIRPMQLPVYGTGNNGVTHYYPGDQIQVFHIYGYGPTMEIAVDRACKKLLRQDAAAFTRKPQPIARPR